MYRYNFVFEVKTSELAPEIGFLEMRLNASMASFGHAEKIVLFSPMSAVITADRLLTRIEQAELRKVLEEETKKKFSSARSTSFKLIK